MIRPEAVIGLQAHHLRAYPHVGIRDCADS